LIFSAVNGQELPVTRSRGKQQTPVPRSPLESLGVPRSPSESLGVPWSPLKFSTVLEKSIMKL